MNIQDARFYFYQSLRLSDNAPICETVSLIENSALQKSKLKVGIICAFRQKVVNKKSLMSFKENL